ncbi:ABC transporter ATP-binding protein [Rhizobium mayense]|uniref:Sn-glycerol-3-phosphate ABC transporter ATP-binding protein UgpC n=1 Tax=Rhizobium mayense TaxID=1312184 RepID=A0ABT7JQV2_9HYPH|nr:sn-glycerol-3-phosphate ABC transporter ATP-binding protein UgpC [Rhizobium mayense]MDL2398135.1 sn-glycerol-3-phosphate ABC transporter ATP-binding protein UgpC [Rhizobium mayense]
MAAIELRKLTKSFGAYTALGGLDLIIGDGEFLVLLGPSGCGKSTTMRIVAGLEEPTSGDILIGGRRVNEMPARDRDLAMVFQNYALYPHMTVGENIGYPLKIRRLERAKREALVREAAQRVDMLHLLSRRPAELSGGQRQRVALARAIVRKPQVFLMDEPLSNLDAKLRTVMRGELKNLQRDLGVTTIYVTHDQVEAMTLADRIVVLNKAVIQQIGTPAEIYARPANTFVAAFIGSPPMNLLPGHVSGGRFESDGGRFALSQPDGEIILGVRPEHVRLAPQGGGHFTGTVFSSELLGDCTILTVKAGDTLIAAKLAPEDGRTIGSTVELSFEAGRMHIFDAASGERRGEA